MPLNFRTSPNFTVTDEVLQLQDFFANHRRQFHQELARHLHAACDTRAGRVMTSQEHGPHLHCYISHDRQTDLYTYDQQPLLQVTHRPDPGTTSNLSCLAIFTHLTPTSPLPFRIQELETSPPVNPENPVHPV